MLLLTLHDGELKAFDRVTCDSICFPVFWALPLTSTKIGMVLYKNEQQGASQGRRHYDVSPMITYLKYHVFKLVSFEGLAPHAVLLTLLVTSLFLSPPFDNPSRRREQVMDSYNRDAFLRVTSPVEWYAWMHSVLNATHGLRRHHAAISGVDAPSGNAASSSSSFSSSSSDVFPTYGLLLTQFATLPTAEQCGPWSKLLRRYVAAPDPGAPGITPGVTGPITLPAALAADRAAAQSGVPGLKCSRPYDSSSAHRGPMKPRDGPPGGGPTYRTWAAWQVPKSPNYTDFFVTTSAPQSAAATTGRNVYSGSAVSLPFANPTLYDFRADAAPLPPRFYGRNAWYYPEDAASAFFVPFYAPGSAAAATVNATGVSLSIADAALVEAKAAAEWLTEAHAVIDELRQLDWLRPGTTKLVSVRGVSEILSADRSVDVSFHLELSGTLMYRPTSQSIVFSVPVISVGPQVRHLTRFIIDVLLFLAVIANVLSMLFRIGLLIEINSAIINAVNLNEIFALLTVLGVAAVIAVRMFLFGLAEIFVSSWKQDEGAASAALQLRLLTSLRSNSNNSNATTAVASSSSNVSAEVATQLAVRDYSAVQANGMFLSQLTQIAYQDDNLHFVTAWVLLIVMCRTGLILRHSHRFSLVFETISACASQFVAMAMVIILTLIGFSVAGAMLWGSTDTDYQSLDRTLMHLFAVMLSIDVNGDQYAVLSSRYPMATPIFYMALFVVGWCVLLNVLVGILATGFNAALMTQMLKRPSWELSAIWTDLNTFWARIDRDDDPSRPALCTSVRTPLLRCFSHWLKPEALRSIIFINTLRAVKKQFGPDAALQQSDLLAITPFTEAETMRIASKGERHVGISDAKKRRWLMIQHMIRRDKDVTAQLSIQQRQLQELVALMNSATTASSTAVAATPAATTVPPSDDVTTPSLARATSISLSSNDTAVVLGACSRPDVGLENFIDVRDARAAEDGAHPGTSDGSAAAAPPLTPRSASNRRAAQLSDDQQHRRELNHRQQQTKAIQLFRSVESLSSVDRHVDVVDVADAISNALGEFESLALDLGILV